MTTFVKNNTEDEEILFAAFGEIKKNQDPKKSLLVKENKSLVGVVKEINDSPVYKKIYRLEVEGQVKPVVVLGKTDLNDKMGYGGKKVPRQVKVGDLIEITFEGVKKTGKGRPYYQFSIGIAK